MSIFISPIHTQLFCKTPDVSKVFSLDRKMFILDFGERYVASIVICLLFAFRFIFKQLASENNGCCSTDTP
jgi:hypothetical protein